MPASSLPLSAAERDFVCGPRSMYAASCSASRALSLARVLACRISDDGGGLLLILSEAAGREVLESVTTTRRIAVVYSDPPTNKTLQLKGNDASRIDLPGDAAARVQAHVAQFADVVAPLGISADIVRCLLADAATPLAALRFTPLSRYEQTPGPAAGEKL